MVADSQSSNSIAPVPSADIRRARHHNEGAASRTSTRGQSELIGARTSSGETDDAQARCIERGPADDRRCAAGVLPDDAFAKHLSQQPPPALLACSGAIEMLHAEMVELPKLDVRDSYILTIERSNSAVRQRFEAASRRRSAGLNASCLQIANLADDCTGLMAQMVDALIVRIPHYMVSEFSQRNNLSRPSRLYADPAQPDRILGALADMAIDAMIDTERSSAQFIDHIALALLARVVTAYSVPGREIHLIRRGLAPWQEKRAKDLLGNNVSRDVTLQEVARECRLSRGHFSKAFKQTTGESPHVWLTKRRIACAQDMLRHVDMSLAEIALSCGFGDQSHLTRVFTRLVGRSPGHWRRTGLSQVAAHSAEAPHENPARLA